MNSLSIREVSRLLSERTEQVVSHLLPNAVRRGNQMVVGSVLGEPGNSLKINLSGEHSGRWKDWATGESGDLLDLWAAVMGTDLAGALKDAKGWLGV